MSNYEGQVQFVLNAFNHRNRYEIRFYSKEFLPVGKRISGNDLDKLFLNAHFWMSTQETKRQSWQQKLPQNKKSILDMSEKSDYEWDTEGEM